MNIPYAFKKCTKCGKWLVANSFNFGKTKKGKWGLKSQCKRCGRKYYNKYYNDNKEYERERSRKKRKDNEEYYRKYYEEHHEYYKDKHKEYYENNKEKIKEYNKKYNKEWRENNKKYNKEWRENNKEKIKEYNKEYNKEYYKKNPEKFFNNRNKRRSRKENQGRGIDEIQWKEMFNFFQWNCAYSGEYIGGDNKDRKRTIDHILALDNGGLNEPWNCIPMVKSYNSSKGNRVDSMNWYLEQEYFDIERLNRIVEWQIYAYEKWGGEEFGELILITDLLEEGE